MKALPMACLTWLLLISPAAAQSAPATAAPEETAHVWRITAGRESVALRDIARTSVPVDASPVAWRGRGVVVRLQHTRVRGRRAHLFMFEATRAGKFVYDTGLATLPRPSTDSFGRIDAGYEYRRDLFTDVFVRGLDLQAGVQLNVLRQTLARHVPDSITFTETRVAAATALVTAVRFRPGSRIRFTLDWANGAHGGRSIERHSADPAVRSRWGRGWLTDLAVGVDLALAEHTSLLVRYFRTDDGVLSSPRSLTSARRSFTIGVTYGR